MRLTEILKASIQYENAKKQNINMCDLTSFSREQLQTLLAAVSHYMVDQDNHAEHYERYQLDKTNHFARMYKFAQSEGENCRTLAVQIMTALQIVTDKEMINQN